MARGAISRRNGQWCFRLDVGIDPATGKRRQISLQGFATKKAADASLHEALSSLATGSMVQRSTETVSSFLDSWLVSQRPRVRVTTLHSYGIIVRRIAGQVGSVALQSLTALHVERLYADPLVRGGRGGGALSAKSVRNTHVELHKALRDAERLGLIVRNPASAASAPRATRPEFTSWSSDDAREFFDAITGHRLRPRLPLAGHDRDATRSGARTPVERSRPRRPATRHRPNAQLDQRPARVLRTQDGSFSPNRLP